MKEIVDFLVKKPNGCLATVSDGKPRVRPWQFMQECSGKFYFCTANTKDVYRQMQAVPFVEFSATSPEFVTVRLSGEVKFVNDLPLKKAILATHDQVRSIYKTADNPIFEVFYIEHGIATLSDFPGKPPQTFTF